MSSRNRLVNLIEGVSTRLLGPRSPIPTVDGRIEEAIVGLDASSGAGLFSRGRVAIRPQSISGYYSWYENDGVVFSSINGLAEAATGQGYYNKMPSDYEPTPAEERGDETPEELELVNDFGEEMNLDSVNTNVCRNMLIAGFCPVETQIDKFPSKSALKVIHPKTVKEIILGGDEYHGIDYIVQEVNSKKVNIQGENLAWFVHNQIANDKRGTSIIKPVSSLLSIKEVAVTNMGKIIDRYLAPLVIWKSTRTIAGIKAAVEEREADQDIYLGNLGPEELKDIAQPIEISGEARFTEFIQYIDMLIYVGLYAPNLYYWKNATEASAKVLSEMVDRNIGAIQRNMKRGDEAGYYVPLMTANNLEEYIPRIVWGEELTGFEEINLENIIAEAIRNGLFSEVNLQNLLKLGGIDIGKLGYGLATPAAEPEEEEPVEDEPIEDEESPEEAIRREKFKKLKEELENE